MSKSRERTDQAVYLSVEDELARIEQNVIDDAATVTAEQVMRWLKARPMVGTPHVIAAVERAVLAVGRMARAK